MLSGLFIIELYYNVIKFHATFVYNQFLTKTGEFIRADAYFNYSKLPYMHSNPKENRTRIDHILLEQFLRKGYKWKEIQENHATVFIITHEKKICDTVTQLMNETYKELRRAN